MTPPLRRYGKILVTGGAGFIGSHLVQALVSRGDAVRVIDNLATGHRANLASVEGRYEWMPGDLANLDAARAAVEGCGAVFHEAAIPSVPRSVAEPLLSHESGPTATANLLEAARQAGVQRVIFAASSSAYGDTVELPKHEDILPQPLSPYAAGKLACESYISVYAQTMGLDGVSLRYFNIYGPRQDPSSPYSGVISIFARCLLAGQTPKIYGDGLQSRDFTYVGDAVQANLRALDHDAPLRGQVLNVGSGRRTSLLELLETMNRILGSAIAPEHAPTRAGDVRDSLASLERIRNVLGYEPRFTLEAGLKETLDWAASSAKESA